MKQALKVQDYEVWVHLGCTRDEQTFTQPVHFTIEIEFEKAIKGFQTDSLQDTIDYVELAMLVKNRAMQGPFHLIEHLNEAVFTNLYEFLKLKQVKGKLILQSKKLRVPVENLRNGVVFSCEATL